MKDRPLQRLPKAQAERWLAAMRPLSLFASWAAPARLLFQNGRRDEAVSPENARAFQEAGSEPKTVLWYDSRHQLPLEAVCDATPGSPSSWG